MGFDLILTTNRVPEISANLHSQAGRLVAQTARNIESLAKQRAPKDTGFLANSILAGQVAPFHWEVPVGADYGIFVEYGTSRMAAQPFLTPAVEQVRPAFEAGVARLIDG